MYTFCVRPRSSSKKKDSANHQKRALVLHRKSISNTELANVPPIVLEALRSSGHPLESETRAFMESKLGYDFSQVRVHVDPQAAKSAHAVNALAFTVGRDIMFGPGQYSPRSFEGQRLLAHELIHVMQQGNMVNQNVTKPTICTSENVAEQEANKLSDQLINSKIATNGTDKARKGLLAPAATERKSLHPTVQTIPSAPLVQRVIGSRASSPVDAAQLARFRALVTQYQALLSSNKLSQDEINEIKDAIQKAEATIRNAERIAGKGSTLYGLAGGALGASAVLAADDATIFGIGDDIALPFTLLAAGAFALGGWIASSSARDIAKSGRAAQEAVSRAIETIGQIVLASQVGDKVRGLTAPIVLHLARILGTTVCGQPPDHQQDPNRDRPKWWTEIKNFIKQIRDKNLSPKQLMRELRKKFTTEQLAEIRSALRRAAEMLKEDPPDFPPAISH